MDVICPRCCAIGGTGASAVGPTGILPVDWTHREARQDARRTPQGPSRTGVRCLSYYALAFAWFFFATDLRADRRPLALDHSAEIGDGIAWFVPRGYNPNTNPSLALVAEPKELHSLSAGWSLKPEFFRDGGKTIASIKVPADSSLYGTGEVTGPLLRNNKSIFLWNTDNFAYKKDDGRRLYQSHPWVLGVRSDGTAFGVLFDTTWKAELETKSDEIQFKSEGPPFRAIIIDRDSPQAVMRGLADLIGKMALPPRWALGYHQCRYSYYPDARVREIANEFRKRRIPCDVIWMDIHYMNGYRIFTYDPQRFPNPNATNDYLHQNGFHSVWMIDPGVKAEPGYPVFDSGNRRHCWVQKQNGTDYRGEVWPGMCVFPDFTVPDVRQWWGGLYKNLIANGTDGIWNDMNEPAVFKSPDWTMPETNVHRGGGALPRGSHRMYHNVYGMLMTRATREGVANLRPEKRPFVLTRSTHLGGQRYAATWTGDNMARDEFLRLSIPMSLNLGLSGQPLSGPDIGGYEGNATPELFGKWIALGAFYPFCRAHASVDSRSQEPWAFGPEIENVSRTALERRYRLMPYIYTVAFNSSATGEPIMQPVFFADPKDPDLRAEESAFLFGPDLLVVPAWAEKRQSGSDPSLPKGIWRDFLLLDDNREKDSYQPTLKIRGGAIIPLGRVIQNTNETSLDPLTLIVSLNENGTAQGKLYEDTGDGFEYTKGDYALTQYRAMTQGDSVLVSLETRQGKRQIPDRPIQVRIITDDGVREGRGSESKGVLVALGNEKTPHPNP
jgi:alpha-glucosidase